MDALFGGKPRLLLILVAFHPASDEVARLKSCLNRLKPQVGYVVVANDYTSSEPVDDLRDQAHLFIKLRDNRGYGAAVNHAVSQLKHMPDYIAALNTDLAWDDNTFGAMIDWLDCHPKVCLATPLLKDEHGETQYLCKRNPTVLALLSRRFWPDQFKPQALLRYDRWFVMLDHDYQTAFSAEYLSGCCMIMRSSVFLQCGGFDESYFLYLEDADLTRTMSQYGSCVHVPFVHVTHTWGRGSYRNFYLALVNLKSAWIYFTKWGLRLY